MNRSTSTRPIQAARRGISLMEVMLATVLLLAAVMALSQVAYLARRHAEGAEDRTQAQLFCQNIMQEILAGARPRARVSPEAFEGGAWVYMVDVAAVEGGAVEGGLLSKITVQVDRLKDDTGRLPTEDEIGGFRLVHWIRTAKSAVRSDEERGPEIETGDFQPRSGSDGLRVE
ncbi:MAG: type IV pilus modification PilV family protein [Pirellulaceae bacterium]